MNKKLNIIIPILIIVPIIITPILIYLYNDKIKKKVRWAKNLKSYHYYNKNNSVINNFNNTNNLNTIKTCNKNPLIKLIQI